MLCSHCYRYVDPWSNSHFYPFYIMLDNLPFWHLSLSPEQVYQGKDCMVKREQNWNCSYRWYKNRSYSLQRCSIKKSALYLVIFLLFLCSCVQTTSILWTTKVIYISHFPSVMVCDFPFTSTWNNTHKLKKETLKEELQQTHWPKEQKPKTSIEHIGNFLLSAYSGKFALCLYYISVRKTSYGENRCLRKWEVARKVLYYNGKWEANV